MLTSFHQSKQNLKRAWVKKFHQVMSSILDLSLMSDFPYVLSMFILLTKILFSWVELNIVICCLWTLSKYLSSNFLLWIKKLMWWFHIISKIYFLSLSDFSFSLYQSTSQSLLSFFTLSFSIYLSIHLSSIHIFFRNS